MSVVRPTGHLEIVTFIGVDSAARTTSKDAVQ